MVDVAKREDRLLDKISELLAERKIMTVSTVVCCEVCDQPCIRITGGLEFIEPTGTVSARCGTHDA